MIAMCLKKHEMNDAAAQAHLTQQPRHNAEGKGMGNYLSMPE